jgi:hypothetical protein
VRPDERVRRSRPVRREVRGATLETVCGVAQQRADGPTRRSSSVSRGLVNRATANSLAADHHGPLQDDRAVKTKLLTGSGLRGLDQGLGSSRACCSRNRPLEPLCTMAWLAQGWAGHPCHVRRLRLTSTRTPTQVVDAPGLVTHWANSEMLESPHIARSFTKARCPLFLSPSNKTLSTAPFPSGMVGRFPEAPIP